MSEIQIHISRVDKEIFELRAELLADIEIMLRKKEFYNINDGTADLKIYMSEADEAQEWEGDFVTEPIMEGKADNGEIVIAKIMELDTDTLLKITDLICKEYDTL